MTIRFAVTGILLGALGVLTTSMLIYFWSDIEAWLNTPISDAEADALWARLVVGFATLAMIATGLVIIFTAPSRLFTGKTRTIRRADEHLLAGMPCWYCKSTAHDSAGHWETAEVEKPATRSRSVARTELVVNHRGIRFRRITAQERNHR